MVNPGRLWADPLQGWLLACCQLPSWCGVVGVDQGGRECACAAQSLVLTWGPLLVLRGVLY